MGSGAYAVDHGPGPGVSGQGAARLSLGGKSRIGSGWSPGNGAGSSVIGGSSRIGGSTCSTGGVGLAVNPASTGGASSNKDCPSPVADNAGCPTAAAGGAAAGDWQTIERSAGDGGAVAIGAAGGAAGVGAGVGTLTMCCVGAPGLVCGAVCTVGDAVAEAAASPAGSSCDCRGVEVVVTGVGSRAGKPGFAAGNRSSTDLGSTPRMRQAEAA